VIYIDAKLQAGYEPRSFCGVSYEPSIHIETA
jgi:hypothetical protein